MNLNIHSIETLGTVDGPGLRYVVFVKGCPLRCSYCHNPDSWADTSKNIQSIDEIFEDIIKYQNFIKSGGVTISGGEPLLYAKELTKLFKKLKDKGIHTCIDTSGYTVITDEIKKLLEVTDLVLLDIKHIGDIEHKDLTGVSNEKIIDFAYYLTEINKPVWIRHVLVPNVNNSEKDLTSLRKFIDKLNNVEKIEILPYHKLGIYKWEELGLEYKLDSEIPSKKDMDIAEKILLKNNILKSD